MADGSILAENLVLVVDVSAAMSATPFQKNHPANRLAYVKGALRRFVRLKQMINPHHRFALVALHSSPEWIVELTNDADAVAEAIDRRLDVQGPASSCDLGRVFESVFERVPEERHRDIKASITTTRILFIYGRSDVIPAWNGREAIAGSIVSGALPGLFVDLLYLHDAPTEQNKCQEIFDCFVQLDPKEERFHLYDVVCSAVGIFSHLSKLLAHPLQRLAQPRTSFALPSKNAQGH